MDLKKLTVEELKVMVYDHAKAADNSTRVVQALNDEINLRAKEEEPKVEEKK